MKKKLFVIEYFLEGLIVSAAATNYIPHHVFVLLFAAILAAVYWCDGMQQSTLYYIPIAVCLLLGQAMEVPHINVFACMAVVYVQYADSPVYHLPQNNKVVGFRKRAIEGDDEEYFEFYPLVENAATVKRNIPWNQGRAFQKIIDSKEAKGIVLAYERITLSYIKRMPITVGEGEENPTKNGMAFFHGRDAAPLWYSSLLIHFASNNFKVGSRQHPSLARFALDDKDVMKKNRELEVKRAAEQYYSVIEGLKCEKLVLVGHSYGCSALLQAYHDHSSLSTKVTHIVLLDPYFFPLPDELLIRKVNCPVLVLANQYLLNFEDVHQRFRIFTSKKNVAGVVWKEGSDLYQTDLCFFFSNGSKIEDWESKFKMNLEAINAFMQGKPVEGTFGDKDLGKEYKPEQYFPERLFIF